MMNLEEVLSHYGIKGHVAAVYDGPLVRVAEFEPEPGTRLKNVNAVLEDVARELGVSSLRAEAVDGSDNIGFEMPAEEPKTIDFLQLVEASSDIAGELPICLGADIKGKPVWADLTKMPHLLVAGTTGSGKSVGLNTFILSLILRKPSQDVKFVLIDPKRIEFSVYNNQEYMLAPVVDDNTQAVRTLEYLVGQMENRYQLLQENMCRNIKEYNERAGHLPYLVCVIDEFADLTSASPQAAKAVQLLAQKARACGIHLILATQRPSVDVVTGVLKANFPSRLAYKVASAADSRTILDMSGAEKLIGRGDALYLAANGELKRVHGAYVADKDIVRILEPYRRTVAPLVESEPKAEPAPRTGRAEKTKAEKSWPRKILDFWSSLRQREKKTIINGLFWLFNQFSGKNNRR